MPENVPRRMMRFCRENENQEENNNSQRGNYSRNEDYSKKEVEEDPFAPNGRPLLSKIPSMNYEDVDSKNAAELKKIQEKNAEEKLALGKVEQFKQQYNRLPTKEESDKIAENLFTQLKNTDMSKLYPEMSIPGEENYSQVPQDPRSRRLARIKGKNSSNPEANKIPTNNNLRETPTQQGQFSNSNVSTEIAEMKSLLEDNSEPSAKKGKAKDEFDMGLDEEISEGAPIDEGTNEIESIDIKESSTCPNCKKNAEKIIFCPKCGTAYCNNCAKKENGQYICPKCGTKTKA
ncbi:MAG: hypothetical protein WC821_00480 [archaeon]|jgi:hypothetical protein